MTYKELKEKIARLETELTEVKEKIAALPKRADGGLFKPEDGQEYWFILASGEVHRLVWNYDTKDHDRYVIGNCFPTEKAAEDAVRVLKLVQKARETQDGFVPNWEDLTQHKYFLDFHSGDIGISDYLSINVAPIFGYWEIKSVCEEFIKDNYADIVWFFTEYRR